MSSVLERSQPTTTLPTQGSPPVRTGRHANTVLVVLFMSLAGMSFAVLQSLVAPALPAIARDVHSSSSSISWLLTAYLLSAAVLTPILGRLGDIAGKRRMLLIVLFIAAAGTLLAAVSTTLPLLIVARAIQGVGGAILPLSIGIVRDELPRERVGIAVGLLSALLGIGGGLGIVLAGPIVDHLSWQWLFWLPLILVLVALAGVAFGVPESPVRAPARLDLLGTVILSTSLVSLLLAVNKGREWGWGSVSTIGLLVLGGVALLTLVFVELRTREPLIDLRLMARRGVWTTDLVGLTFGFGMFGLFLLVPMLLELPAITGYGFGKTVTTAGLFLLPAALMMLVFGPLSGLVDRRFGPKVPLVLGSILLAGGFVVPAMSHGSSSELLACVLLIGAGVGMGFAAMANAIVEAVPIHHTAEATSVNSIVRTIGGSVGTAVIAAVIANNSTARGLPTDHAFTVSFWVCVGAGGLAVLAALALPSARKRREEAAEIGVEDLEPELEEVFHHHHTAEVGTD
jgi:EmrB/QacA subfamily drug resistance transporter